MSADTLTWIAGIIITLMLAVFGYLISLTRSMVKLTADVEGIKESRRVTAGAHTKLLESIPDIQRQLDRMEYRQELEDAHAATGLHSPSHIERDHLVDALLAGELDRDGLEHAICLLQEARMQETMPDKRFYAMLLLTRAEVELAKIDRRDHPNRGLEQHCQRMRS